MDQKAVILLVEDNRLDIELTLDAFREVRLSNLIKVVETGEEALDYVMGRGEYADRDLHPIPNIILLDIRLPGISGFDFLKEVKRTPGLKRLPVIILTSSQEESDRLEGYDLGVNSYLMKPISFSGFLDVVNTVCEYWLTLNLNAPLRVETGKE